MSCDLQAAVYWLLQSHEMWIVVLLLHVLCAAENSPASVPTTDHSTTFRSDQLHKTDHNVTLYSHLRRQGELCAGNHRAWLCDPGKFLTSMQAAAVNHHAETFLSLTPCLCNASVCVSSRRGAVVRVIVNSEIREQNKYFDLQVAAHTWKWKPDRCGDVVVVILAPKLKRIQVSLGEAVKRHLSDSCVNFMVTDIQPFLNKERFYLSIVMLMNHIRDVLEGTRTCRSTPVQKNRLVTSNSKSAEMQHYLQEKESFGRKMAIEFPRVILPVAISFGIAIAVFCIDWKKCYRYFILGKREPSYW